MQKRVIRSRDVIIDEYPVGGKDKSSESLRAKIGWEPETVIEQLKISEKATERVYPLDQVTSTPTPTTTPTSTPTRTEIDGTSSSTIQDVIVVRPPPVYP